MATREAWEYLKTQWLEISGSFEDLIDCNFIEITINEKLFGIPTPEKTADKVSLTFLHIKDVVIGNMQKTIYDTHKRSYFNNTPLTAVSLIQQWRHKMAYSVNLIINRMKQRNKPKKYTREWIFCKPANHLLTQSDETNFKDAIRIILQTTLHSHQQNTEEYLNTPLTSDLLSSDSEN